MKAEVRRTVAASFEPVRLVQIAWAPRRGRIRRRQTCLDALLVLGLLEHLKRPSRPDESPKSSVQKAWYAQVSDS